MVLSADNLMVQLAVEPVALEFESEPRLDTKPGLDTPSESNRGRFKARGT